MMLLDRYIFRTVFTTTLVVLAALLVLDTFFNLLNELEDISENYGLRAILQYLLLSMPNQVYEILPVALLVGGLLGMGSLATHSELIVMRGAGRSLLRLVGAALSAGLVLSVLVTLIGEYIAPASERLAKVHSFAVRTGHEVMYRGYNFWARDGDYLISIGAAEPGPTLIDIAAYQLDEQGQLLSVAYAQRARYRDGSWLLEGIEQRTIRPEAITRTELTEIAWDSVITPQTLEVLTADPDDLAMRELLTYIAYLEDNGLDTRRHQLAFWTKALAPLANLSMLFIAMPFAFTRQRSAGMGQRLVIGILLGLAFFLLNRMLGNIVLLYNFPPIIGAALPMVLFYGAGALALSRLR